MWTSAEPFDYEGEFYQVKNAFSDVKPLQRPSIPIYFGGASGAAVPVGAKHADVYMFWGEPLADTTARMDAVRSATPPGRSPAFSVSVRPILGATEAEAWDKAHDYLERIVAHRGQAPGSAPAAGSQRLLDLAAQREVFDDRLWMAIAAATGAGGNTSALVGTPEQVAQSLLRYYDAGITSFLIRGFEPLQDATEFGRELIPLVREGVARRRPRPPGRHLALPGPDGCNAWPLLSREFRPMTAVPLSLRTGRGGEGFLRAGVRVS